jgi:PAS domain S-box-containing protein
MRDPLNRGPGNTATQADRGRPVEGHGPTRNDAPVATLPVRNLAYERPALLAGLIATTIGVVVLVGWATGLEPLRGFLPGTLPMKANAALLLALSGTVLTLQGSGRRTRVEDALAIVVLGVAGATALEFATGVDLGIDRLLASDVAQPGAPYAGRMALGAVIGFAAMALGLLALGRSWRGWHPTAFLAIVVGLIGGLGILGYLYGASELTSIGSVTQIAFPAALGFGILAAGLAAADPAHRLMRLLRDPGLAGQLTRRLVPTIVLVLPVAGWLKIDLVQAGILDERVGVGAMVCLDVLVFGGVGIWIAGGVERLEAARVASRRERDRAEDQLRVAQSRQARFFDANIIGALIARPTGVLLESNDYFLELVGRTRDELARGEIDLVAMTPLEWQAATDRGLELAQASGRTRVYEKEYLRPDGIRVPVIEANTMLSDPEGLVASFVLDNTEHKAADVALRESEERFRTLIESANDAVFMWDGDLRCLEANRAACERLGYTRDEMLTMKATDISAPEEVGRAAARAESIARKGSGLVETVHKRQDGSLIQVEVSSTVVSFGGRTALLSVARDITERKSAEARYRGLLEAAPDAMVVVDQHGEIVLLNVQAEKQFGYNRDELVGQPVTSIILEGFAERIIADQMRSAADALAQQIGTGIELVALRKDGSEFPI